MTEFAPFPKIGRLSREAIVTEKIDGTNAQVMVGEDGSFRVGSRTRWITVQDDNYGFAAWAHANEEELRQLGPGRHFGEWWGRGVQRNYSLTERRFSLFNVSRWAGSSEELAADDKRTRVPACCHVVPVILRDEFDRGVAGRALKMLAANGSYAAPGFMSPEGVVIFHTQSGALFKKTFEKDDAGKGREPEREIAA